VDYVGDTEALGVLHGEYVLYEASYIGGKEMTYFLGEVR